VGRWVPVARVPDIPPGTGRPVEAEGRWIAVFNVDGSWFAIEDTCPHQGASLGEGTLYEGKVICPWHSWIFDLRTGACPRIPGVSVATYRVRISADAIEVELPDPAEDTEQGGRADAREASS